MKKIAVIFFCILTVVLCTQPAFAADKYIVSEGESMQIVLDENGDARVTETRSYYFGGDRISRYTRHYLPNGYTISDFQVSFDGQPMTMLAAPDDSRPVGCAAAYRNSEGYHVDVYMSCQEERHIFTIAYQVTDAVYLLKNKDGAGFRWNLSTNKEPSDTANFSAEIIFPSAVSSEELSVKAPGFDHGWQPLQNGDDIIGLSLTESSIPKQQAAYVKLTIPKSIVPGADRVDTGDSESKDQEDDNIKRADKKVAAFFFTVPPVLIAFLFVALIVSGIIEALDHGKKGRMKLAALRYLPQPNPSNDWTMPDDLPPAYLCKLFHFYAAYDMDACTIQAGRRSTLFVVTLMDLANRGSITLRDDGEKLYIGMCPQVFVRYPFETPLIELLLMAMQEKSELSTDDLNHYAVTHGAKYRSKISEFFDGIQSGFDACEFTEMAGKKPKRFLSLGIFAILTGVILLIYQLAYPDQDMLLLSAAFSAMISLVATATFSILYKTFVHQYPILSQDAENRLDRLYRTARHLDAITNGQAPLDLPGPDPKRNYVFYNLILGRKVQGYFAQQNDSLFDPNPPTSIGDDYSHYMMLSNVMDDLNTVGMLDSSDSGSFSDSRGSCDCGGDGGCDSGGSGGDFD